MMKNKEHKYSLLIIDDNKEFLHVTSNTFKDLNKFTSTSGESGLNKFKKVIPDITLLDIDLPDISGLELLKEMIKYEPESFIVMLTKDSTYAHIKKAIEIGAVSYVLKPFSKNILNNTIDLYKKHIQKLKIFSSDELLEFYTEKIAYSNKEEDDDKSESITKNNVEKYSEPQYIKIAILDIYTVSSSNMKQHFENNGYILDVFEDEITLLQAYQQNKYEFMLINTNLESIDSYQLTTRIRELEESDKQLKKAIIIGLIKSIQEIKEKKWYTSGMDDFVQKPAKLVQIIDCINKNKNKTINIIEDDCTTKDIIYKKSKDVAIIDSYSINLANLRKHFAEYGYNLSISTNKKEFFKKYQKSKYSVIFINSELEDSNGYQVAQLIRKYEKEDTSKEGSILIGLVKSIDEIKEQFWKKSGMNDFLNHPVDLKQFLAILKHYKIKE